MEGERDIQRREFVYRKDPRSDKLHLIFIRYLNANYIYVSHVTLTLYVRKRRIYYYAQYALEIIINHYICLNISQEDGG